MSKTAATIATLFTAIIIGAAAETATYVGTNTLDPRNAYTALEFKNFMPYADQNDPSYKAVLDFVTNYGEGTLVFNELTKVEKGLATVVNVVAGEDGISPYTYYTPGEEIPDDAANSLVKNYDAVRRYLRDAKDARETAKHKN